MIEASQLVVEPSVALSPVQLPLRDMFLDRPPRGPLSVRIDRVDGPEPMPIQARWHVTPAGELGFVGLGRGTRGGLPMRIRVVVEAPGMLLDAAGEQWVELDLVTWNADEPPAAVIQRELRFHPGPDYRFGAGVPVLPGVVFEPGGAPAALARVTNEEIVRGAPRVEEVRTNTEGQFRLPLRWSSGLTAVRAAHPSGADVVNVLLPNDLTSNTRLDLT